MRSILILGFLLLLASCATAEFVPSESGLRFPPWSGEVRVLDQMPKTGFERVGVVTARGGVVHGTDELTRALKARAAEQGANAIVVAQGREFSHQS